MIWVVVSCRVWASAPGKTAVTVICGGASGGNWAIGSERMARPPAIASTSAITIAKIGRSMKKRDTAL